MNDSDDDDEEARRVGAPVFPRDSMLHPDFRLPGPQGSTEEPWEAIAQAWELPRFNDWAAALGYRAFARILFPTLSLGALALAVVSAEESFNHFLCLEIFGALASLSTAPYIVFFGKHLGWKFRGPTILIVIALGVRAALTRGTEMHALLELSVGMALPAGVEGWLKFLPRAARKRAEKLQRTE